MVSVAGLWVSPARKSGVMRPLERARAVAGHGFEGCAHASPGRREVLLASAEHLEAVGVEPGRIRENITVADADVQAWPIGQRVRVGGATLEVTMECEPCARMEELRAGLRDELAGRRGMLARVVESGEIALGDEIRLL